MKKFFLLSIIVLFVFCFACSDPKTGTETNDDAKQYLEVNEYVTNYLETKFKGSLPTIDKIDITKAKYYYRYECGVLGDPNFIIHLENLYNETEKYIAEESRLQDMSEEAFSFDDQTLYIMQFSEDALEFYNDEKVYDGLYFVFEMAIANSKNQTVRYLSALQQDSNKKYDIITRFIDVYNTNTAVKT